MLYILVSFGTNSFLFHAISVVRTYLSETFSQKLTQIPKTLLLSHWRNNESRSDFLRSEFSGQNLRNQVVYYSLGDCWPLEQTVLIPSRNTVPGFCVKANRLKLFADNTYTPMFCLFWKFDRRREAKNELSMMSIKEISPRSCDGVILPVAYKWRFCKSYLLGTVLSL